MHINTLFPRCLQSIAKFHATVYEELRYQTVHYYNQYMVKIQYMLMELEFFGNMHFYTLCPKSLQSFANFNQRFKRSCAYKKTNNKNPTNKQPGLTDGRTGQNILPFATSLRGI